CANNCTKRTAVFAPSVGVCTSTGNAELVKTVNVDYIEAGVQRFLIPFESDEKFAEKLAALQQSGVTVRACNGFIPGSIKSTGPKADHDKLLKYAETAFQRAQKTGIKIIVFGSSGSRNIPKGFDRDQAKAQFVSLLKRMGPIAAKYDVTIAIEPLNRKETNFIISVTEGHEIVKLVDHKNIRLLADFYHMLRENEGPESIVEAGKYLVHAHIAENEGRHYPGKNGEDFTPYLVALKQIGYSGSISMECRWGNFSEELAPAAAYLRKQIAAVNVND
ncbi:MAG: sugar phosphate isomerase/epimerase, partial [Anaerohalosphaera sp.]|nr:sugar phosphate isomerase/epimerase [Anaerohalosphaera sp.]